MLITKNKWFKNPQLLREQKYIQIMYKRGYELIIKESYDNAYIANRYTKITDYTFYERG